MASADHPPHRQPQVPPHPPTERTPLIPSSDKKNKKKPNTPLTTTTTTTTTIAADKASPTLPPHPSKEPLPCAPYRNNTTPLRFWLIFSQILLIQFLVYFDATIMASSHPVITSYFHASRAASWLSTSFLLTSTAFQSLLGRISDATGRKPVFVGCLIVFTMATGWCAAAGSMESLIAARAVCGLGAGGLMTVGNIITSDLVPLERRGLYQTITSIIYGVGGATGAALGGFLAERLGWRWEFGIQVPALLVCLGISLVAIPEKIGIEEDQKDLWKALRQFDLLGSILLASLTSGLILGLDLGGNIYEWSHPLVISSFAVFLLCVPAFLWVESRALNPVMPWNLITNRPRVNILFSNFVGAALTSSILFNMPIYFRAVLLTSATTSGLNLILPSLISCLTSALAGILITYKHRLLWPLLVGASLYCLGMLPFCLLRPDFPAFYYFLTFLPSFMGQGFLYMGAFMALLSLSSQREQGAVIGALLLWRNLGMVLGIATSSLVVQNGLKHFLREFLTEGARKEEVMKMVMTSIEAVAGLEEPYQGEVRRSFDAALRVMFGCAMGGAVLMMVAIVPVRLPRLGAKSG